LLEWSFSGSQASRLAPERRLRSRDTAGELEKNTKYFSSRGQKNCFRCNVFMKISVVDISFEVSRYELDFAGQR